MNIAKKIPTLTEDQLARFHRGYVIDTTTGCWNWTRARGKAGYGVIHFGPKQYRAHRVSYALNYGDAAGHLVIDHLCRNTSCVNPAHLEAVSNRENILRGVGPTASNVEKTHCPRGHSLEIEENLIPSLRHQGRACRSCDTAARGARHRKLKGDDRERFIRDRATSRYMAILRKTGVEAVAA